MWNEAIIVGYAGKDPEVRSTNGGDNITTLSLATSERWKDKSSGEQKERTEWHRIVLFGRLADIAGDYVKKGSLVMVRGEIRTRKWSDQSGTDRYTTEIVVSGYDAKLKILDKGASNGGEERSSGNGKRKPAKAEDQGQGGDLDDDIPF